MDCPKCKGNGELLLCQLKDAKDEYFFYIHECAYCSGSGYIDTLE